MRSNILHMILFCIFLLMVGVVVLAHEPEDCDCYCIDDDFSATAYEAEVIDDVKRGVEELNIGDRDAFFMKIRKDLEGFERIEQRSEK